MVAERDPYDLPSSVEEIDRDWLTAAFRTRYSDVTVNDFAIADEMRGASTKLRLRLDLDEHGRREGIPSTVILKGGYEPHSVLPGMNAMYAAEARFYGDLQPELGLQAPVCYFAAVDPNGPHSVVIMEDLVALGVTFCSALQPQRHDQVLRRLSSLARYHAQSWNSADFEPGKRWDWLADESSLVSLYYEGNRFFDPERWEYFVVLPCGAATSVHFHDPEWVRMALRVVARVSDTLPRCILHADTHLNNLYEDPDGTPGFFDSIPVRGVPLKEITYHIGSALDPSDRRRWEGALVQHYLDELERSGVDPPGFDESMYFYALFLVHGYLTFLVNAANYQPEAINTANAARFSAAMIDHRTKDVIDEIRASDA